MRNTLQTLIENAGFRCQSYSGRGMYGKLCLGVVCEDMMSFFGILVDSVVHSVEWKEDVETIARSLRMAKQDNMGHDTIVYWPMCAYIPKDH